MVIFSPVRQVIVQFYAFLLNRQEFYVGQELDTLAITTQLSHFQIKCINLLQFPFLTVSIPTHIKYDFSSVEHCMYIYAFLAIFNRL